MLRAAAEHARRAHRWLAASRRASERERSPCRSSACRYSTAGRAPELNISPLPSTGARRLQLAHRLDAGETGRLGVRRPRFYERRLSRSSLENMLARRSPKASLQLIPLLVLGAVGLALIIVGVTGDTGWTLIVPGFVALPSAYAIQALSTEAAAKAGQGRRARLLSSSTYSCG